MLSAGRKKNINWLKIKGIHRIKLVEKEIIKVDKKYSSGEDWKNCIFDIEPSNIFTTILIFENVKIVTKIKKPPI